MNTNEVQISEELLRFWAAAGRNVEKRLSGPRVSHLHESLDLIYDPPSPVLEDKLNEEFSWASTIRKVSFSSEGSQEDDKDSVKFSEYGTCYVRSGGCLVNGGVLGDVPGVHFIQGLRDHEVPVIATYVHPTIAPGFSYRVRLVDDDRYLFKGEPLPLVSVGRGYGKRITFASETKNENDNYFYSDTNCSGYGFELQLVPEGSKFTIYEDCDTPIGEAVVNKILEPEVELNHRVQDAGGVMKRTQVSIMCETTDYKNPMAGRQQGRCVVVTAVAVAIKGKKSSVATLKKLIDCSIDGESGFTLKTGVDTSIRPMTLSGSDINDVPTKYNITGVLDHEMPVVGTYVDQRIIPGFKYSVRPLDSKKFCFDGQALPLQSVGRGYAKRFTFSSESQNYNDNYFWSDSNIEGFGFSIEAVCAGDTFSVVDIDNTVLGEVQVYRADAPQVEESTEVVQKSIVRKRVRVGLTCDFKLTGHEDVTLPITGTVLLERVGRETAKIIKIEDIATEASITLLFSSRGISFVPA